MANIFSDVGAPSMCAKWMSWDLEKSRWWWNWEHIAGRECGPNSGQTKPGSSPPLLPSPPKLFIVLAGEIRICSICSHRGGPFSVLKCLGSIVSRTQICFDFGVPRGAQTQWHFVFCDVVEPLSAMAPGWVSFCKHPGVWREKLLSCLRSEIVFW